MRYLFYLILLQLIIATPQINLYYTDLASESNNVSLRNCLRFIQNQLDNHLHWEIKVYCISELPSEFKIENNDYFPKFTFDELWKENITSEDLYLWSASIDLIEDYQFYLNQLSTTNDLSLKTQIFYNCTIPRFGPMCQYQFPYQYSDFHSLYGILRHFFTTKYTSAPTGITCYEHLQCNRGPSPACLDWTEICDGKIDCLDGGLDEKHCWQFEINQCNDDEYRCMNGECIPKALSQDKVYPFDCIDGSDRTGHLYESYKDMCTTVRPSFGCDDMKCDTTHVTSSCLPNRRRLLIKAIFSLRNSSVTEECWSALRNIFNVADSDLSSLFYGELCPDHTCKDTVINNCPDMLYFPNVPVFFGDIYFAFKKNESEYRITGNIGLLYICYNNSHYDDFFNMTSKILFNNSACFLRETISDPFNWFWLWDAHDIFLHKLYNDLKKYQLIFNYTLAYCNRSSMYQCINSSKCISIHRLMDNIIDCPYMDDEDMVQINNTDVIEQLKSTHYKCRTSNKYIHQRLIQNDHCDCGYIEPLWCEDEDWGSFNFQKNISFQTICDGYVELVPVLINEQNETDETECEQWDCNNIDTRCDGIWNCPNGADEIGCRSLLSFNCSPNHHICISPYTNQLMCLHIAKANDGKIDCIGATDELIECRSKTSVGLTRHSFHCMNQTSESCIDQRKICDSKNDCEHGDDEQFCKNTAHVSVNHGICWMFRPYKSDLEKFLCNRINIPPKKQMKLFSVQEKIMAVGRRTALSTSIVERSNDYQPHCYRGVDLHVWLNNENESTIACLCPLSFYGDKCQYQNQRVSLSLQFYALSDSRNTAFVIIVSLIDDSNQRIIHSYEQIFYLWIHFCINKFPIYLVYSNRPKDPKKNYSIHIDIYEKNSFKYRGSFLYPISFSFLPVHRLAYIVNIPRSNDKIQTCSNNKCVHGKCIKYLNNPKTPSFCQCDEGWSGKYCDIQHNVSCAPGSLSIGIAANNQSICVCAENKYGLRCLLIDKTCQNDNNSECENGGQCISNANYVANEHSFICICPEGFSGDQCEVIDYKLILSFNKDIALPQSIFIHYIDITVRLGLTRSTTFRTVPIKQDSIIVYWQQPFHVIFTELSEKTYYLTYVRNTDDVPLPINKTISPSDRCSNISELFNETFLQWNLLRRIKYYHLPCQNQSLNLSCFHDDIHLCLCYELGQKRLANCFNFDHHMKFDCQGYSECENDAECFQDDPTCPKRSICMCRPCFYGSRCQFRTSGFGLSLDGIIGYHILPHVNLIDQPSIIQFSFVFTIIFMVIGFIDGIICVITFKNKIIREVGCGIYLLGSSIATLFTIIMFGLKFFTLVLAQITIISNRSFLQIQCYLFDYFLRICLNMDQWLNACVAFERTVIAIKKTGFDKKQSRKAARFVIIILLIIIATTSIHDPIYRRLINEINDVNEKRIWCVVIYPFSLQMFNSIIHTLHFFGPFILNLVSAIILIIMKSRQQLNIHKNRTYKKILREQIQEQKHLLTAPIILVILAFPRLILTFVSKCMKSSNDAWIFVIGYFISFIPSILTSVIFILPSEFYKKEFYKSVVQYRTKIQRRLCLM